MSSLEIVQAEDRHLTAKDAAFALAVVLPLAAIIAPYRHIHLPQLFILAIALLGGLYCFRLAVTNVEQLLFVFLLYIPFQKVLPGDFGGAAKALNFTNAFLVLLLLGWLVCPAGQRPASARRWTLLDWSIILFLVIVTLSITASALRETEQMRYEMLSDLKRWLTPFALYFFITSVVTSEKTVKKMLLAVLITTAVIGLLGVKQFWLDMGGGTRTNLDEIRIEVTSGPSNLGAFFAYYVPYLAAVWLCNLGTLWYWSILLPLTWCMDALRTTFSRGAMLACLIALAAVVWRKSRVIVILAALALIPVISSGFELKLPYGIFGRMADTYRPERSGDTITDKLDKSAQTRITIWQGGLKMVRENALFGVGYAQFPNQIGAYAPEVAGMDPHNNVLKIAAEMGVPAAVSFLLLVMICFWRGYRLYGRLDDPLLKAVALGYVGSIVGLFIANLFGSRLDSEEITTQFWAMTGAIVALERQSKRAHESTSQGEGDYAGT